MEWLTSFFGRNGFLPHGYCFTWEPGMLWTMIGADGLIAAAYFSIPLAILTFVRKRGAVEHKPVAWLFSAFIFACGITHLMDIWVIWQPDYGAQALTKVVTATLSVATAMALWLLIPEALKIPSPAQLRSATGRLEAEVNERQRAEAHLFDIEQNLAVTLGSIGAGFIATDDQGRVTRMNAVAEQVTGWPQGEALGRTIWEVFAREGRPAEMLARNPIDVMLEQGTTVDQATQVMAVSRDGMRTPLEVRAALTRGGDGQVRGLAMVFRDMSSHNRAEADRHRLAAIVESSNDAIIGKTLDGRITSWNRAAEALFGYSAAEAIDRPVQMLLPPERQAEEMRILANLVHGKAVPPFDTVRRAKDGSLIEVSIAISPIRDGTGRIIGASKIARDVSQQRRADAALRESDARLRFALESAGIGHWEIDLNSGAVHRSILHDRCFGYDHLQPAWGFDIFLSHVHPDDRADISRSFHEAVADTKEWHTECRVIWPDTSQHWIAVHGSVRREGDSPRMLGIVSDVTRQHSSEEARLTALRLETENRQIQEANRLKSQFLANMSHELRTPLNAIIGFADLMHDGVVPHDSPQHHQFLGHIATSGRHLLQLINDVLDLSKVESGKFEFYPEPVNLPQLINEVCDVLHTTVQRKNLNLQIDIDVTLTELVLDPARLKQTLYNYLSNAIKFTPEDGLISIRARPEGPAHFRLEVEDSGIGIDEADLSRLFVEFQQLDNSYAKQHAGTGLGLALTRRLVQAQGGTVGVRSTLGTGSVFHLVLRRVNGAAVTAESPAVQRLLVIEDDSQVQGLVMEGFAQAGFSVDLASTGEQALAHVRDRAYDAISLELLLPDHRGLGALARIRSEGCSRTSPVLAVALHADAGEAATFAVADVLCKPIRTAEVVAAVARLRPPGSRRPQVMVIDDDPVALELMRATLKGMGVDTVGIQDGRRALYEMEQHRPDGIILDLMMPEFDGFAVLDELRRIPEWRHTPVFIWTSMLLTDEEYATLAQTARAILGKGGGALVHMLEAVSRWRPATASLVSTDAS